MDDPSSILAAARSIMLVDWPSRSVPDSLARAGYEVVVKGGPEPDHYATYEVRGSEVVAHRTGRRPEHADVVYVHRPLAELPGLIALAQQLRATTLWYQSGRTPGGESDPTGCWLDPADAVRARTQVEAVGLRFEWETSIVAAARSAEIRGGRGPRPS